MCAELRCAGAGFSVLAHRFFLRGAWRDARGGGWGSECVVVWAVNGGVVRMWL